VADNVPEMQQALRLAEVAAYTEDQLMGYHRYWDGLEWH
jgi:hypothetical protein